LVDGGGTAAFSGDAPISVERFVEGSGDWRSEILKAGHHGSRTASDESWIETVHPTYAVISVGRNNHYGHPNREVLDRLTQDGVTILRTDQDGDIEFDYDGKTFIKQPSGG
jgi:competence protein ComEC